MAVGRNVGTANPGLVPPGLSCWIPRKDVSPFEAGFKPEPVFTAFRILKLNSHLAYPPILAAALARKRSKSHLDIHSLNPRVVFPTRMVHARMYDDRHDQTCLHAFGS